MLLAIDIGNTNIVFAVYDGQKQRKSWRSETDADITPILSEMFEIEAIIVCSVVPRVKDHIIETCETKFKITPVFITHQNAGIDITLDAPHEVGADRLVNAVAVSAHYKSPAVIVDFGTATTFDVIDKNGAYCGGVIAPGINLSLQALHMAAAKLPEIGVEKPEKVIGRNTKEAMQSGIYWGYIGLIEGTIKRITEEMGVTPYVLATGGLAPLFDSGTDMIDTIDGNLTMKGLVHIHAQLSENEDRKSA